ncbi:MAG: DUF4203 domain-containing protein [bacterium]|nr:DUF4203 domain-containing protein [Candidatus Sumerlaeota bacterium]
MQSNTDIILTIAGAALCLGGWVIFWVGTRLLGVAVGAALGFVVSLLLAQVMDLRESALQFTVLGCSVLGAFAGFFLIRAMTAFIFCLMGFLFGALLGRVGAQIYFQSAGQPYALSPPVVAAILGTAAVIALLSVWLQKHIMIIITSFIGAAFLTLGVPVLMKHDYNLILFLMIFIFAALWQTVLVTRFIKHSP